MSSKIRIPKRKRRLSPGHRALADYAVVIDQGVAIRFRIPTADLDTTETRPHRKPKKPRMPVCTLELGEAGVVNFRPSSRREAIAFSTGVLFGRPYQFVEAAERKTYALEEQMLNSSTPQNSACPRACRHLVAIFAADVAGYSRFMERDEAGTLRALFLARAMLGGLIVEHGGRVANIVGDSVLAEFASAVDAVQCAILAQAKLTTLQTETTASVCLPFRIAVHVADVVRSGSDIFGDGVNVCARLQEIAAPSGCSPSA